MVLTDLHLTKDNYKADEDKKMENRHRHYP